MSVKLDQFDDNWESIDTTESIEGTNVKLKRKTRFFQLEEIREDGSTQVNTRVVGTREEVLRGLALLREIMTQRGNYATATRIDNIILRVLENINLNSRLDVCVNDGTIVSLSARKTEASPPTSHTTMDGAITIDEGEGEDVTGELEEVDENDPIYRLAQ